MEIDQNKGRAKRGMENPLSAIFDLADDVSDYSRYVKKMVWYAIIFMFFWLFFNFLLILQTLSSGIIPFILLGVMISGLVAIWLILRTHMFFKYFTNRYAGIKTIRDTDQPIKIPNGTTIVERYLTYLRSTHPIFDSTIKKNPKSLNRQHKLKGRSGDYHDFDLYFSHPPEMMYKLFKMGEAGYGLYVKKEKGKPKMTHILDIKKAVIDVAELKEEVPSRIVILYKYPASFNGLSDDLYSFLVREEFKIELKGKTYYPVIQVVGETDDGFYDFTPLVPEFADRLP